MDPQQLLGLYRAMVTARQIDKVEQELTNRGEAFFHVSGAGHEGAAVLASHLHEDDWIHCHYRDKALLIARGMTPREFFDSLFYKKDSHSGGRQMCAHMSSQRLKVVSQAGPVGNAALHAAGVATAVREQHSRPIVVCSNGDGATQEGEFLESVAEAVRMQLPVLYLIQDNHWAISTVTKGQTFFSRPDGDADEFYGLPIHRVDGRHVVTAWHQMRGIVEDMRQRRMPGARVVRRRPTKQSHQRRRPVHLSRPGRRRSSVANGRSNPQPASVLGIDRV